MSFDGANVLAGVASACLPLGGGGGGTCAPIPAAAGLPPVAGGGGGGRTSVPAPFESNGSSVKLSNDLKIMPCPRSAKIETNETI